MTFDTEETIILRVTPPLVDPLTEAVLAEKKQLETAEKQLIEYSS